MMEMVSGDNWS